jgi:membrane-associated phospholipid phosphatase
MASVLRPPALRWRSLGSPEPVTDRGRERLAVGTLAGFVALAGLIAAGRLAWLDQWSAYHVMTQLHPTRLSASAHQVAVQRLTVEWAHPASILWFAFIGGVVVLDMLRRRRFQHVFAVVAATVVAGAGALAARWLVERPILHAHVAGDTFAAPGLGTSYPSGHVVCAALLSWIVLMWLSGARSPRARLIVSVIGVAFLAWLAGLAALLVVAGWHTPTDVLGALLLAIGAAAVAPLAAARLGGIRARRLHELMS